MGTNMDSGYNVRDEFRHDIPVVFFILLMVVGGILAYPHLPAIVPTHWNAQGHPNGYSTRLFAVIFMPALALAVWLMLVALPAIDPRRRNYASFIGFYRGLRWALVVFLGLIFVTTLFGRVRQAVNITLVINIVVPALFIFIGNSLQKVRFNYFVGVRTPWTLANEEVWRLTHRFASRTMVIGGLVGLAGIFFPPGVRVLILMAGIVGGAVAPAIYSYFGYRKVVGQG